MLIINANIMDYKQLGKEIINNVLDSCYKNLDNTTVIVGRYE